MDTPCKYCGHVAARLSDEDCPANPANRHDHMALYARRAEILADPAISFWLKDAIRALEARDPVDAAKDADLLAAFFDGKCKALLGL